MSVNTKVTVPDGRSSGECFRATGEDYAQRSWFGGWTFRSGPFPGVRHGLLEAHPSTFFPGPNDRLLNQRTTSEPARIRVIDQLGWSLTARGFLDRLRGSAQPDRPLEVTQSDLPRGQVVQGDGDARPVPHVLMHRHRLQEGSPRRVQVVHLECHTAQHLEGH